MAHGPLRQHPRHRGRRQLPGRAGSGIHHRRATGTSTADSPSRRSQVDRIRWRHRLRGVSQRRLELHCPVRPSVGGVPLRHHQSDTALRCRSGSRAAHSRRRAGRPCSAGGSRRCHADPVTGDLNGCRVHVGDGRVDDPVPQRVFRRQESAKDPFALRHATKRQLAPLLPAGCDRRGALPPCPASVREAPTRRSATAGRCALAARASG